MAESSKEELVQLIKRFGAYLTVKMSNLFSISVQSLVWTSFLFSLSFFSFFFLSLILFGNLWRIWYVFAPIVVTFMLFISNDIMGFVILCSNFVLPFALFIIWKLFAFELTRCRFWDNLMHRWNTISNYNYLGLKVCFFYVTNLHNIKVYFGVKYWFSPVLYFGTT